MDNIYNPNVSELLQEYQTGVVPEPVDEVTVSKVKRPGSLYTRLKIDNPNLITNDERNGFEAAQAGWGESRFDRGEFVPGEDLEQERALEQSGANKILAGLAKGGVTAATTAVNTTLGTVMGAGTALFSLASGEAKDVGDVVGAGVNNWLSEQMMKIQTKSEEWFPNYRTEEERTDQYQQEWYKHILTPNFIGDSILKNFGFTIGAIAGGYAWTKGLGAIMRNSLANNLMRGVAAAADGDRTANEALATAISALKGGKATSDDIELIAHNIMGASKQINSMNPRLQLYGSLLGAMGEGTTEGVMAKNEYLEDMYNRLDQQYMQDYSRLEDVLKAELNGTDAVKATFTRTGDGQILSDFELNDKGKEVLEERRKQMADEYLKRRQFIDEQGEKLAATTYLLNLPVLTTSNLVQFGKLFSGGFKTAKSVKGLIGGIETQARVGQGYMMPKLVGEYAAKENVGLKSVLGSLKVAGTEASEEMSQGFISSGAKNVAEKRVAAFNNDSYDAEATDSTRMWFGAMFEGGSEYLKDTKNWQEGFLGALTGLFGIPGKFWKGQWNGGLIGEVKNAKAEQKEAQAAADKLNLLVNSREFQDRWHGYIRHLKYDNEMAKAADKNDSYTWHTASDKQLINDVLLFADMGRVEDLQDVVNAYASVSAQQIPYLKSMLVTDKKVRSDISDKEVVEKVQERAGEIQNAINLYKDTYDKLAGIISMDEIPDYTKELIFTRMQMKNFERRFNNVYDEVVQGIKPKVSISEREDDESLYSLIESVGNRYKEIFDQETDYAPNQKLFNDMNKALEGLAKEAYWDAELREKASDLFKLYNARKEYYDKYQYLKSAKGKEDFIQQAVTPATVQEAAAKEFDKQQMAGVETFEQMQNSYAAAQSKGDFVETLRSKTKDNAEAKKFVDMYDTYNGYRDFLFKHAPTIRNNKTGGFNAVAETLLNDLFQNSTSDEDFVNNITSAQFDYGTVREQLRQTFPDDESDIMVRDLFNKAVKSINDSAQEYKDSWKKATGVENANPKKIDNTPIDDNAAPEPNVVPSSKPEVKAEPVKEEIQEEQEKEDDSIEEPANKITAVFVEEDSNSAFTDTSISEKDSYWQDEDTGQVTLGYYQQSIPEIAVGIMSRIRDLLEKRKTANRDFQNEIDSELSLIDRSNFVTFDENGNPVGGEVGYADNYKYLQDNDAFRYIAEELNTNDELVFAILPDAPKYEGKDQIVVAKVLQRNYDGEIDSVQPLTFLHSEDREGKASDYMNLDSLYSAILADFETQSPEGGLYIFGGRKNPKTSKVFDIRPGIIRYNKTGKDSDYRRIDSISSYSANAPIMILDEHNRPILLRGNVDVNKIFMPNIYPWSEPHYGRMYYLVKNGNDTYTPILLDKESITMSDVVDAPEDSILGELKNVLGAIDKITNTVTTDNIAESNDTLSKRLGELTKLLNIDGLKFEYDNYNDIPRLYILAKDDNGNGMHEVARLEPGESIIPLLDNVLHRPVRISPKQKWLEQSKKNLDSMITAGKITSNAQELRQVGVNFLFNPWDGKSEFKQLLSRGNIATEQKPISSGKQVHVEADAEFGDFDITDFVGDEEFSRKNEVYAEPVIPETPTEDTNNYKNYDSLSKEEKEIVDRKKFTKEFWDRQPQKFKDRVLGCK